MLNLKKLIASIAAITVALSTVSFAATYTDVAEDSAYYEAVESLSKLGIVTGYEDGTYKPEETVTRAEMAALIARIQGYDETAKGGANTVFTDVPASHWASGYVAQASNQGIVNGYGDGTFGPEDPVLYEQAVKMIMATLGYTPFAENNGSYPTGYLTAASRYGVVDGVSNAVIGTGANRGTIAQLLANAIDTPIMGQSKWATDGTIEYTIYDGVSAVYKTLMSENLGVVKLKGIVEANTVTDIDAAKTIDNTKPAMVDITITSNFDTNEKAFKPIYTGNTVTGYEGSGDFLVGDTDAEDYLGMSVVFYVVENDVEDMWEIISIAAESTKNETVSFTLDQFEIIGADASGDYIKYYKEVTDRDPATIRVEAGIDTVYNNVGGKTLKGGILSDGTTGIVDKDGKCLYGGMVTLINNDTDSLYDVAFVEVAATAVVKGVSEDGIAFKKGINLPDGVSSLSEIEIDADADDEVVVILKDGEAIDYTTLTEWDVLSVIAASDRAKCIVAEVIGTPVVGTVEAAFKSETSAANTGYTVAGTKYDVAKDAYGAADLEVGAGGTIYVDKYGKIAAFNEDLALATGVAGNYGFVTKAIVESDAIDGQTVTLQMVTANGVETFDLASSVTFKYVGGEATVKPASYTLVSATGDTTFEAKEKEANQFFYGNTTSTLRGQVIKYTTNSNGKVNTILVADHDVDKFDNKSISNAAAEFDADNLQLKATGFSAYVDADTTVFFVGFKKDRLGTDTAWYDTDDCLAGTVADLEDKNSYNVVAVYADNKATDNNIIVVKGGLNQSSPTAGVAVITSVAQSEVDGDAIYVLTYNMAGEEVTADTVAVADLGLPYNAQVPTIGDVVKVKVNGEGKISGLSTVWNFADGVRTRANALSFSAGSAGTNEAFDGGYVTTYQETSEQATLNGVSASTYKLSQAENVYVIEATSRGVEVRNGSSSSYKYYENLYKAPYATVKDNGTAVTAYTDMAVGTGNSTWVNAVKAYTDYVFVRTYEGKVKDLVIVKGARDISVSAPATVTVTYDVSAITGAVAPAADVILKGAAVTLPTALVDGSGSPVVFTGWKNGTTVLTGTETYSADTTLKAY